jgi:replicative DNA helicase
LGTRKQHEPEWCETRVPPYDKSAEEAVLGAILLNNRALEVVHDSLAPEDFYVEAHRRIYQAIVGLWQDRCPIDHVTLGNRLIAAGDLERIGGASALGGLTEGVGSVANVEHYAGIVRGKAAIRRMIYAAQQVVADGFADKETDPDEWIARAQGQIDSTAQAALAGKRAPRTLFSYADDVRKAYEQARAGVAGLPTPWPTINAMTGGLRWGTITAFVARPSIGKSTAAILIARHVWKIPDREERVLIVSPEMSAQDMAERYFVIESGVPYMSVVRGQLSGFEEPKLWDLMGASRDQGRLWIIDGVTDELTERSVEYAIRSVKPTLVAIDSFYDLNFPGRDDNERVRNIARWLYQSCKRHRYACVVGSQQNREQEKSKAKGGGSRLGTIAFSDAIAQRFDAIFAMERDQKLKERRRLVLKPLKIRRGFGLEDVELHWDFAREDFSEAGQDPVGEQGEEPEVPEGEPSQGRQAEIPY